MLVDKQTLMENLDHDMDLLVVVYETFCEECVTSQKSLEEALDSADVSCIKEAAHKLKGMMASLAAQKTQCLLEEMENIDSAESIDQAKVLYSRLKDDIRQLHVELDDIIKSTNGN